MAVHFSSNTDLWATPQKFFEMLDAEFNFTLDPCCNEENKKCEKYYTLETDGLSQNWDNESIFMNPPYGREIGKWVKKASEARGGGMRLLIACPDRYEMVPRLYIQTIRDSFHQRSSQVWQCDKLSTISKYGRCV